MLIKRRNALQILPRKEIACEQANKEENVRENNEYCKKEERVTENNEPCESLSEQDEDSTLPAMFEVKSSKLKVSKPRFCSTVGKDPHGSMGEGLGEVSPISKGAVPVL